MKEIYRVTQPWGEVTFFEVESFSDDDFKKEVIKAIDYRCRDINPELMGIMADYYIKHDLCEKELEMKIEILEVKGKVTEITPTVIERSLKQLRAICQSHGCASCPCFSFCPSTTDNFDYPPANWDFD